MLFSTPQEINHIIPTAKFAKIENLISRLNAEEMSSLYPLVGLPLLQKFNEDYAAIGEIWSNQTRSKEEETKVIILRIAQEILLYSYLANHSAILQSSFNMGGGWNSPSTGDYDALDSKGNDRLDKDLWHSARRSKENMLLYLEMDARDSKVYTDLWQQSDYYYQHQDLLFTTPSELHPQYINLGDTPHLNFQAYVSTLHDCQDGYIAGTIGYTLLNALISRKYNTPVPTPPNTEATAESEASNFPTPAVLPSPPFPTHPPTPPPLRVTVHPSPLFPPFPAIPSLANPTSPPPKKPNSGSSLTATSAPPSPTLPLMNSQAQSRTISAIVVSHSSPSPPTSSKSTTPCSLLSSRRERPSTFHPKSASRFRRLTTHTMPTITTK